MISKTNVRLSSFPINQQQADRADAPLEDLVFARNNDQSTWGGLDAATFGASGGEVEREFAS